MISVLTTFSSSIWNATLVCASTFAVIYLLFFISLRDGDWFYFDPKDNRDERLSGAGDFSSHAQRYQDLAKLVVTLSAAAIAFLVNAVASSQSGDFSGRLRLVPPIVVGFFGCAIALELGFMFLQTFFYEQYCHSPTHSTYTRCKYALCIALGGDGLVAFILGFAWLAHNMFVR